MNPDLQSRGEWQLRSLLISNKQRGWCQHKKQLRRDPTAPSSRQQPNLTCLAPTQLRKCWSQLETKRWRHSTASDCLERQYCHGSAAPREAFRPEYSELNFWKDSTPLCSRNGVFGHFELIDRAQCGCKHRRQNQQEASGHDWEQRNPIDVGEY